MNLPADEHVVDLKIWFMGESMGDAEYFKNINSYLGEVVDPAIPRLNQDQPITISLDNTRKYNLFWHPIYTVSTGSNSKTIVWDDVYPVEAQKYQDCIPQRSKYLSSDEISKRAKAGTNIGCGMQLRENRNFGVLNIPEIKTFFETTLRDDKPDRLRYYSLEHDTTIRFKPVNTDIIYAIEPTDNGLIDSLTTHIESTGYYGNTQRKQEARINRQKNQLLGIFDYAIFSGGKLVKPRP